jgi:nucleoside phosphorylase
MTKSPLILVCFAVREEAAFFRKLSSASANVRVLVTGIGKRNSERAIRAALEQEPPGLIITSGFAGALREDWQTGDIVYDVDQETNLEPGLAAAGAQPARFHCAPRVASTASEKRALRTATGAEAVEMESEVIRAICREKQIPGATIRVILDTANEDLPLDFNRLMTEQQTLSSSKLATAVLKSPGKIPALIRLQKQTQAASKRLGETLAAVLLKRR